MEIENLRQNDEIEKIKDKRVYTFNLVSDMKSSNTMKSGDYARTLGYYTKGKGAGFYRITSETQTVDNIRIFKTANNLYAILIDNGDILSYGADDSGEIDCTEIINLAIKYNDTVIFSENGTFLINNQIILKDNLTLEGKNSTINTTVSNLYMVQCIARKNVTLKNLTINNAHRCLNIKTSENIRLENIHIHSNEWAILFRLCKNVYCKNIFFNQPEPDVGTYNNTDGIHINGLINGQFENIFGYTGDDFIALNADEPSEDYGDIKNVTFINCRNDLNTELSLGKNSCYRPIRLLAIHNTIENVIFKNCNFTNDTEEDIIISGNTTEQLIDDITFDNCTFVKTTSNKNLFLNQSISGTITFSNCNFINTANYDMFMFQQKINSLSLINCNIQNTAPNTQYLFDCQGTVENLRIVGLYGDSVNKLRIMIVRSGIIQNLELTDVDFSSTETKLVSTYSTGKITNIILDKIKKIVNGPIVFINTPITCNIFASNVSTEIMTTTNANPTRLVGGISDKTPSSPVNGDYYFYKNGNNVTLRIFSNGSWVNVN